MSLVTTTDFVKYLQMNFIPKAYLFCSMCYSSKVEVSLKLLLTLSMDLLGKTLKQKVLDTSKAEITLLEKYSYYLLIALNADNTNLNLISMS